MEIIGWIVGVIATCCAIIMYMYNFTHNTRREKKKDSKEQTEEKEHDIYERGKIEGILSYIKEAVDKLSAKFDQHRDPCDKLFQNIQIEMEKIRSSTKSAHHRLDEHLLNKESNFNE